METASFVKGTLGCVCTLLLKELSYLCHYKDNIKTLGEQERKLNPVVKDVKILVEQAKQQLDEIKGEVQNWLDRATEKCTEAQNLVQEELARKNHIYFCACCCSPDWLSRYTLSKKAVSIATKIGEILEEKKFKSVTLLPYGTKPAVPVPDGKFMLFESTKNAMEHVLKALKDEKIKIVGFHGMPGVGKTTLVKRVKLMVFNEGLFDRVGMATVKQTVNLREIQGTIADSLGFKLVKETEVGRATELREKIMALADERILIILDDLWDEIDLSSIGIPIGSEKACELKILLATRRQHVCHIMGCKENVIHLNVLSPEDSYKLFKKTAGPVLDSPEFEAVSREIAGECQGLPLAIYAVAKALGDKKLTEWQKAATRLKRYSEYPEDRKVMETIKMSYDFVKKPGAKKCFLMCCLFPEDHNINKEVLARYGMGLHLFGNITLDDARGDADTFINDLIDSGLLLKGDKDGCVKMHDVIRDTAKWITSPDDADQSKTSPDDGEQSKTSPEKKQLFMARAGSGLTEFPWSLQDNGFDCYNAVSVMFNNLLTLPDELVCPKLEILLLQEICNLLEIPSGFFNRMDTLKVLDVSVLKVLSLPPSIGLLQNLCTLHMDRCKSKDISILGGLERLEILSLKEALIDTFPEELAELSRLRLLDMTSCKHIKTISPKIISRLHRLEELYLQGSFCEWGDRVKGTCEEINASLEEVINLRRLTILKVDIVDVNCFPPTVEVPPIWEKFDICIARDKGSRVTNANTSRLKRAHTRTLFIDTMMSNLPDWFFEDVTKKAEMLIYSDCQDPMDILKAYDKGRLFDLKSLYVEQCHEVQCLIPLEDGIPNNPTFEKLQELHIHHMESLKEIWVGQPPPRSFEKLKFLEVKQCSCLENSLLRSNIIQRLHNLEKLLVNGNSITEVFGFEGLQEGPRYLQTLKKLRLENLSKLTNIWKGPAQLADFSNVKTVFVNGCDKLRYIFSPSMTQGLLQLEVLWVEDCSNLEEIIQKDGGISLDKITLPQLKTLALQNLENLVNFYDGNSYLERLENVHVRKCPKYRTSDFPRSNQVQFDNESHYKLLKKRLNEPEDISIALE